jgi:2-hydroxychromene-2-carboxylate isomerase
MLPTVNYYLAPSSPWTYLGHQRFTQILNARGINVRLIPVDLGGKVFPATGGLPVVQRSAQRQAYRLVELRRFSDHLGIPLNLKPKYFPVSADLAAKLIIVVQAKLGQNKAMQLLGGILSSVWEREEDIADPEQLKVNLKMLDLDTRFVEQTDEPWVEEEYDRNTMQAIEHGVFGSPSYVLNGEIFWGQDRLDFLDSRLREIAIN